MRLTLRTLLAYLDDALEPHETREIGKKIQESSVASALVSRVREVIRKRRLGALDVEGPAQGIDPNVVAQYLDSTLSPEQVAQVETLCLESDMVLAEVAACHQVLSTIQGDPLETAPRSRDRFYALGPVAAEAKFQVPRADSPRLAESASPLRTSAAVTVSESADHFREELADRLKTPNWSHRVGPAAGAALVIVALVLVIALDRDLFRGMVKSSGRETSNEKTIARDDTPRNRPVSPTPHEGGAQDPSRTETPRGAAKETMTTPLANLDPIPPADVPEPTPKPQPKDTDVADAATVVPKPVTPVIVAPQPATPAQPAESIVAVPVQSVGVDGVLLRYHPADTHWYVQPRRSELHAGEVFACPDPFEASFEWDQGLLKTTLLGDTAVQILPAREQRRYHILLRRGRIVFQPGATAKGPTIVVLTIGGKTHDITLATPATTVGVEVRIDDPSGYPGSEFPNPYRATLYAISGEVQLAEGVTLSSKQIARLAGPVAASSSLSASSWPAWLDPTRRAPSTSAKLLSTKFEDQFDSKLAVELSIPALLRDTHANLAEFAAKCVSLMESYPAMVQGLTQLDHKEARAAAASGLRSWLALAPENGMLLKRELETHFPAEEAQAVERLLWGYTREQAKDKLLSQELVDWLRSNHLVVRELAFQQLVQLTGRRNNYVPNGTPTQRELGIQHWQNQLKRDGALLKSDD